jgi:hypothetical protein
MPSVSSIAVAAAAAGGAAGAFLGIIRCAKYIFRRGNDCTIAQKKATILSGMVDGLGLGFVTVGAAANVAGVVVTGNFDRISSLSLLSPHKDLFGNYIRIMAAGQFLVDVIKKGKVSALNIIQIGVGITAAAAYRRLADITHPLWNTVITSISFMLISAQHHTSKLDHPVFRVVGAVGFANGLAASLASINAYFAYIFARGSISALEGRYFSDMMQNASGLGIAIAIMSGGTLINLFFYTFGFVMQKIGANGEGSDMHRMCCLFVAIGSAAASTPLFVIGFNDAANEVVKLSDDNCSKFSVTFLGACGSIFGAAAAAHMCGANAPVVAAAAAGAAAASTVSFFLS